MSKAVKRQSNAINLICALAVSMGVVLAGCGGGAGTSVNGSIVLSGTAAQGAPFPMGSSIVVTDAVGTSYNFIIASNDGSFSINLPATAKAPLVLTVSNDDLGLAPMISAVAELKTNTVNITPATNVIAALLAGGDPSTLAASIQADPALASNARIDAQKAIFTTLAARMGAVSTVDPVNGRFAANGTGHDKDLDTVIANIKVVADANGGGKIVLQPPVQASNDALALSATTAPKEISIAKGAAITVPTAAALQSAGLVADPAKAIPDNTSGKLVDLLERLTGCFAQSQAARVGVKTTSNAQAMDIVSSMCKSAFYNNDPSTYKNNSYVVGGGAGNKTAFSGIFTSSSSYGVTYAAPVIQYVVKNGNVDASKGLLDGDVVFTSRWTAPFDGVDGDGMKAKLANADLMYTVARAGSDGKLYLIGNQSNYDIDVSPRVDFRDLAHANMSKYSYVSTGYSIFVNSKHNNVAKAIVTSPKGDSLTLKQITGGGYGYMGLAKSSDSGATTATTTTTILMAAQYVNTATTSSSTYCGASSNHPRDIDPGSFWTCDANGVNDNWSDSRLTAIPDQATWKFELYAPDNTLIATEYRRTISRAATIAELLASKAAWPTLTTGFRSQLIATSSATGGVKLSGSAASKYYISVNGASGKLAWGWQLASDINKASANKWTPNNVKIYGKDSANGNVGFDDFVNVYSSWRMATISCAASSASDQHCTSAYGVSNSDGTYKAWSSVTNTGVGLGQIQLNGYDSRRVLHSLSVQTRACIDATKKPLNSDGSNNSDCKY